MSAITSFPSWVIPPKIKPLNPSSESFKDPVTLPHTLFTECVSFLSATDLQTAGCVSPAWKNGLDWLNPISECWAQACKNQGDLILTEVIQEAIKWYSSDELTDESLPQHLVLLVANYVEQVDYKNQAMFLKGTLRLVPTCWDVRCYPDPGSFIRVLTNWGRSHAEPCVHISIESKESIEEARRANKQAVSQEEMRGRSWQDGYSRLPGGEFPGIIPLRFLLNKDGQEKTNRDVVKLEFKGQKIVLQCFMRAHGLNKDYRHFPDFRSALQHQISCALSNRLITDEQINEARHAAQTEKLEYIKGE
jgi:hypothetical protein